MPTASPIISSMELVTLDENGKFPKVIGAAPNFAREERSAAGVVGVERPGTEAVSVFLDALRSESASC